MDQAVSTAPAVPLYIGGKTVQSTSKEWRDVVNPATQEVVARVPFATRAEVDQAVANAKARLCDLAQDAARCAHAHHAQVPAIAARQRHEARRTGHAEHGKTLPDAEGDVFRGLEVVEHACRDRQPAAGRAGRTTSPAASTPTRCCSRSASCAGITAVQLPGDDPAVDVPDGDRHAATPSCSSPPSRTRWSTMRLVELAHRGRHAAGRAERGARRRRGGRPDLRPPGHQGGVLRRLDQGRHPRLQPRQPGRQARAVHDGREEPRRRSCRTPTRSRRSTTWSAPPSAPPASAAWPTRWWSWWARRASWLPEIVDQGEDAEGQRRHATAAPTSARWCRSSAKTRVERLIERGVQRRRQAACWTAATPQVAGYAARQLRRPDDLHRRHAPTWTSTRRKSSARCCAWSKSRRWTRPSR